MATPRVYVQAPPVTPLPFGLFSAATVVDEPQGHWLLGGVQYEPDACGVPQVIPSACEVGPDDGLDETEGIDLVVGDTFVIAHLFTCKAPGSIERGMDRARAALRNGEQRAVEGEFARLLPLMEGAVDLTPTAGTPVHAVEGLAILEGFAGASYGGTPTIHVPRQVGTILSTLGATERVGTKLQTKLGSDFAAGGGYAGLAGPLTDADDPATIQEPGAGEAWLYVTGQVVVRRSANIEVQPTMALATPTNDFRALVERPYVVTTECIVSAVLVSTSYGIPDTATLDGGGA